ncbi:MAG TPA: biopolymer transporter ExbD [Thermoguttaceae bacterium]|nr:biopolymer transporter ExbD [Thermoguttaceae bacterium]HPP53959.1 biopolymer transporter ExbD [Thermoguttaceae bacterium]
MQLGARDETGFQRIELNMTPMIDVCFQLLIFFMLTLKVFATEGDFHIKMPIAAPSEGKPEDMPNPPITVRLKADDRGRLASIQMVEKTLKSFQELREEIKSICAGKDPTTLEVELDCDYVLRYEYVMEAITHISGYVTPDGTIAKLIEKIKFKPARGGPVE